MNTEHPLTHYIVMGTKRGYWGRGETVQEAIQKSEWLQSGDEVRVIKVDAEARVNEMGDLNYNAREHIGIGRIAADGLTVRDLVPPPRALKVIAAEIKRTWTPPYFGAVPYIDAMLTLNTMHDTYFNDDAQSVVAYFLSNAATWRGDTARRIKAELKAMLKRATR